MNEDEERTRQAEARVGSTLKDRWRLDKLLGVGGMASVYAATHRNQKRVAVKVLHRELSAHPEVRARFLREGYLANTVGHAGVVVVDDDDVLEDGSAFLVMELLEGETLEQRRARAGGTLSVAEVLGCVERLLGILVAAHDKGVVHRDLKPENVFLTLGGEIKILDFGIARLHELSSSSGGTRIGAILGTPAFMAPEQARARWDEVDGRTDLWAVGATAFLLLSGRFVHEAGTVNEELGLAMTARALSLASVAPHLPAGVVVFVDRALAYEKEARWRDARTMLDALRTLQASLPATTEAATTTAAGEEGTSNTAVLIPGVRPLPGGPTVWVAAAGALLLATGAIFAVRGHGAAPAAATPAATASSGAVPVAAAVPSEAAPAPPIRVVPEGATPAPPAPPAKRDDEGTSMKKGSAPKPSLHDVSSTPKPPAAATVVAATATVVPKPPSANPLDRRY
jgi:serine/threonine-protein kinase